MSRDARRLLGVALAICTLGACWIPGAALAHGTGRDTVSALPAGRDVQIRMQAALRTTPREMRRGRCGATARVEGIGEACVTADGLFRVPLASGSSATTHGLDAPPPSSSASLLSASQSAVTGADVSDISCVNAATTKHTVLVYAYPSGGSSRYSTIAPLLREETYKLSAFLGAESRAIDPDKNQRLLMQCDTTGMPVVRNVQLAHSTSSDSFSTIVQDLVAQGYGGDYTIGAKDRYLVFYDASLGGGVAGTGHLYDSDEPSTTSYNNVGGLVAVEFNWGDVPHWDTLLHEAGHNMGAVQQSAPHNSGTVTSGGSTWSAGHCSDGQDIMCYSDGGSNTYNPGVCTVMVFDCNRNDYFNPSPATGSYLDTHWNIAAPYNSYLQHAATNDTTPPSSPPSVTYVAGSTTALTVRWTAATDDVGVAGYHVWELYSGSWQLQATVKTRRQLTIGGLPASSAYDIGVSAFDAGGNESAVVSVAAATTSTVDVTTPSAPSSVNTSGTTMTSIQMAWNEAADDIGAVRYDVYRMDTATPTLLGGTHEATYRVSGLAPGTSVTLGVRAVDDAGHASALAQLVSQTSTDTAAPTTPRKPRRASSGRRWIKLAWGASTDNVRVRRYHVYMAVGTRWKQVAVVNSPRRVRRIKGLRRHRRYGFVVRAEDTSGNLSNWSTIGIASTR